MPWLEKDKVLFIHVPRCGGTSITKHHRVGEKARKGKNLYYRAGIMYYYYRYKLLETANFPLLTYENLIALFQVITAFLIFFFAPGLPVPFIMWTMATLMFVNSTIIWTAPITMRNDFFRNLLMVLQGRIMCGFGSDVGYLIGTNSKGYLFHLTAERCIRYGYVSEEVMKKTSFSIVRNPYSRAVSMYHYNKRWFESFEHFMRDFHARGIKHYHMLDQTDSKDIYCHILPMHEYTHLNGKQVVNTIIKQEHLKRLVATEWKDSGVPTQIQEALTGIPHANARKKKMPWQDYYTQETMDLVLEMYEKDFDIFGYDKKISSRPELVPKIRIRQSMKMKSNSRSTAAGTMLRQSISIPEDELELRAPRVSKPKNIEPSMVSEKLEPVPEMEEGKEKYPKISGQKTIFDDMKTVSTTSMKLPNYESKVEVLQRATSAGEDTSEREESTKYNEPVKAPMKDTLSPTTNVKKADTDMGSLLRKKRSASAFVLHVG